MKKLQNLIGVKTLSKKEQQSVKGGGWTYFPKCDAVKKCSEGYACVGTICLPIPV